MTLMLDDPMPKQIASPLHIPTVRLRDVVDPKELVKAIAMDIGKDTVAYVEVMYPKAIEATSSTFKTSLRNHIYNQIMAAIEVTDEGEVIARLRDRKNFRRWWTGVYRKLRRKR